MGEIVTGQAVLMRYAVCFGPDVADMHDCRVEGHDPQRYKLEAGADSFRFYDKIEIDCIVDGEVQTARTDPFNLSPFYVPGGRLVTGSEREALFSPRGEYRGIHNPEEFVVYATPLRAALVMHKSTDYEILPPQEG